MRRSTPSSAAAQFRRRADRPDRQLHHRRRRQAHPPAPGAAVLRRARLRGRAQFSWRRRSSSSTPRRCCTTTSSTSRGCGAAGRRPTRMFGNAASVLVGDFLYSRAFQMMVDAGHMRVHRGARRRHQRDRRGRGAAADEHARPDRSTRATAGHQLKTAKLFEASARLGAVLAEADARIEEAARDTALARHRVPAGRRPARLRRRTEEIGKNVGDDLREGKPTLPLIIAMRSASAEQRELVVRAVRDGDGDFEAIVRIVLRQRRDRIGTTRAAARSRRPRRTAIARPAGLSIPRGFARLVAFRSVESMTARRLLASGLHVEVR